MERTITAFDSTFEKLKKNRGAVPLAELQTTYGKHYRALVAEMTDLADWFCGEYLRRTAFPPHPQDKAGNRWLAERQRKIMQEERQPGGRVERYRSALIDDLDCDRFELLVYEIYHRMKQEAFAPYWQRHNRWVGPAGNRWMYNDITELFWQPPCARFPAGCWVSRAGEPGSVQYPPQSKEDL